MASPHQIQSDIVRKSRDKGFKGDSHFEIITKYGRFFAPPRDSRPSSPVRSRSPSPLPRPRGQGRAPLMTEINSTPVDIVNFAFKNVALKNPEGYSDEVLPVDTYCGDGPAQYIEFIQSRLMTDMEGKSAKAILFTNIKPGNIGLSTEKPQDDLPIEGRWAHKKTESPNFEDFMVSGGHRYH
jgi:hypothetical protein